MENLHKKRVMAMIFLVMLASSPLSVSYSFTENANEGFEQKLAKGEQSKGIRAILAKKIVSEMQEVRQFALPEDYMNKMILENAVWTYTSQKRYESGIILFDGKASRMGNNYWELSFNDIYSSNDSISAQESYDSHAFLQESYENEEFGYKVIFTGKISEFGSDSYYIIFYNSNMKNLEDMQNFHEQNNELINSEFTSPHLANPPF